MVVHQFHGPLAYMCVACAVCIKGFQAAGFVCARHACMDMYTDAPVLTLAYVLS